MKTNQLYKLIVNELVNKIQCSKGLENFALNRSKFEGWLKVEIIDILVRQKINAIPEHNFIDVTFEDVAIELKTINTNYKCNYAKPKRKPITKNVSSVINDIDALNAKKIVNKFVIFVVFPVEHLNLKWQYHLMKITSKLSEIKHTEFVLRNNIPIVIYLGKI